MDPLLTLPLNKKAMKETQGACEVCQEDGNKKIGKAKFICSSCATYYCKKCAIKYGHICIMCEPYLKPL